MIKDKLIVIDLDNTIVSTIESIVNLNNKLNPNNYIEFNEQHDWKLYPMVKTGKELSNLFKLFDHKDFYKDVIVFPNAIEIINELAENNRVVICSKHSPSRIPITTKWINKVMPKVEIRFVDNFEDKGKLFDNCDYIIDDRVDVLDSFSHGTVRILYGLYQWNKDCGIYYRCMNWNEVKYYIEKYESYKEYKSYYKNNPLQFVEDYLGDIKLRSYQKAFIKGMILRDKLTREMFNREYTSKWIK